jgi:cell division protein FtsL
VLVTAMVVGLVSLSALVVGSSLRSDALRTQIATLSDQQGELSRDVATLSAPSRVMSWARSKGMVMADNVVILRVAARSAPRGPGA